MNIADLYRMGGGVTSPTSVNDRQRDTRASHQSEFARELEKQTISFSQHAQSRIHSRAISWDSQLETRVKSGINQASTKGSKGTLIIADHIAIIADVKSRTIITAMDRTQLKESIFTNIDSTVFV